MKVLLQLLAIGVAGFFGAIARYLVARGCYLLMPVRFPIGTLVVNLTGSLLLGYLLASDRLNISESTKLTIAVGFIGAYTTFSSWAWESNRLIEQGAMLDATINLLGSLILGLIAIRLGIAMARR